MPLQLVYSRTRSLGAFAIRAMPISPSELWELRRQHTDSTAPVTAQEGSR